MEAPLGQWPWAHVGALEGRWPRAWPLVAGYCPLGSLSPRQDRAVWSMPCAGCSPPSLEGLEGTGPTGRSYAEAALEGAGLSGTRLCRVMSFSPSGCAPSDPHVQLLAPLCTHHRYSVSTHPVQAMFPEPR